MTKKIPKNYKYLMPHSFDKLVRVGGQFDGGYVVAQKPLDETDLLISFGLGETFDLEIQFVNKTKTVHVYDHTVSKKVFLFRLLKQIRRFFHFKSNFNSIYKKYCTLKKYHLLNKSLKFKHHQIKITDTPTNSKEINVDDILKKTDSKNIFFSIDIEGDEYKIIKDLNYFHDRINIIVLEFHDIEKNIYNFEKAINLLNENFLVIHLHGNNCSYICENGIPNVMEVTFVNKKKYTYLKQNSFVTRFPIKGLDQPNYQFMPDHKFEFEI